MNFVECSICTDRFGLVETNDETITPCGHVFHGSCLNQWLESGYKKSCPECRYSITSMENECRRIYFRYTAVSDNVQSHIDQLGTALTAKSSELENLRFCWHKMERKLSNEIQDITDKYETLDKRYKDVQAKAEALEKHHSTDRKRTKLKKSNSEVGMHENQSQYFNQYLPSVSNTSQAVNPRGREAMNMALLAANNFPNLLDMSNQLIGSMVPSGSRIDMLPSLSAASPSTSRSQTRPSQSNLNSSLLHSSTVTSGSSTNHLIPLNADTDYWPDIRLRPSTAQNQTQIMEFIEQITNAHAQAILAASFQSFGGHQMQIPNPIMGSLSNPRWQEMSSGQQTSERQQVTRTEQTSRGQQTLSKEYTSNSQQMPSGSQRPENNQVNQRPIRQESHQATRSNWVPVINQSSPQTADILANLLSNSRTSESQSRPILNPVMNPQSQDRNIVQANTSSVTRHMPFPNQ